MVLIGGSSDGERSCSLIDSFEISFSSSKYSNRGSDSHVVPCNIVAGVTS